MAENARFDSFRKQDPTICYPREDTNKLKMKGWENKYHTNQKKARMRESISEKRILPLLMKVTS